ncbi:ATP-dependent sacrificial sulfur transferase LarE [bacterium]|nr:ATP-dependent sacrificial sulfur transferase LarE [bacterium]
MNIDRNSLPHRDQFDLVFNRFRGLKRVLVAYSGGVDSSLLLKIGTLALGENCIGIIANSAIMTPEEIEAARKQAAEHRFALRVVHYSELDIEDFASNPPDRCYYCKRELFTRFTEIARELGAAAVIEGSNADDAADWRPGFKAVTELSVVCPLREAGLRKQEIRDLARALGLASWDKPSNPCLSSRIAYGVTIDREKLAQVADGERFIRAKGFRQVRVRHHGDSATVEVGADELHRLNDPALRQAVIDHLLSLGFPKVEIDPNGYRMGSLNAAIRGRNSGSEFKL